MNRSIRIGILFSWLFLSALDAYGQCTSTAAPTIDAAGRITASGTYSLKAIDRTKQRIIDARPNRVFAADGKTRFGNTGTVVITNMNPFLFEGYRINIQEEEIKDQALIKFAKALIPIAGDFIETQKQEAAFAGPRDQNVNLDELITRLTALPTASPAAPPAAAVAAKQYMVALKDQLVTDELAIRNYFTDGPGPGPYPATSYVTTTTFSRTKNRLLMYGGSIFDRDTDTIHLCDNINALLPVLQGANAYPSQNDLKIQRQNLENLSSKARVLKRAVELYKNQDSIKNTKWIGSTGFDYLEDLNDFADAIVNTINTKYNTKSQALFNQVVEFDNMKEAIENLKGKEGELLQQDFPIGGKYDFSKVTVTVQPFGEKTPNKNEERTIVRNGDAPAGNDAGRSNQNGSLVSPPSTGSGTGQAEFTRVGGNGFAEAGNDQKKGNADPTPSPSPSPAKITDVVTTGKPRFEIGVGMVYSNVEQRQFQVISGFARDPSGNLTNGETLTKVVGFSEQTDHRFLPIALLHTRLTNNPNYNLYFSLGITGSRDKLGTNIEYLIGPSVNITDNIFITAGAFAARRYDLAGEDLFLGAKVPDGFDTIPVRSRYQWKPGLSFSYRLPTFGSSKKTATAGSGASDTYTDTLYVGQPRFSISAGMAYSPLADQTFQPIIGFARNRSGVLTSGETFAKVVGFNKNSDGRLLPMALFNTRIKSNDEFGLHFSLGITAKRADSNTDVEYLIGPSFSFMKNQIVFTAGAYAGKQQKIAGDLFINAALASGTTLTTQKEYHIKPGVAFSYRLPVKLP